MKKLFFVPLVCLFVLVSANAYAATKVASHEASLSKGSTDEAVFIDKVIGRLTIYLSLTDTQARQIKPIIVNDIAQRREIYSKDKSDKDLLANALDTLHMQTDRKLSQYLTDKQVQKFDELQKEQPATTETTMEAKKGSGRKGMGRGKF